ncbi:hypothetical protein ALC62_12743, partial [Cyphomyrmex costatus]
QIVSRKVTKFITKKALMSKEALQADSNRFIENVKHYIDRYGSENVYNSNQSGFQLELHAGRTLAQKGVKKSRVCSTTISAITHSYTIQPVISADGRLFSPLYAWYKSGYLEHRPIEFDTPVDFCFKKHSKPTCDICGEAVFFWENLKIDV